MTSSPTTGTRRSPGRPRDESADRSIIEATLDMLAGGEDVLGLSIESIAARAGVAKGTVYRRWPNRRALIADAIATLDEPVPELPGRSLREDVLLLTGSLRRRTAEGRTGRLLPCVAVLGRRDPELMRMYFQKVVEGRRGLMRAVLQAGIARGEVRGDLDVALVARLLVSSMLAFNLLDPDAPRDDRDDYTEAVVDIVLDGVHVR